MLLDRGALVQEGPVYRPAGTIESLEVPETLHALIAARLDGLPAAERRVVQDAAVLGKTFTKQALAALSGECGGRARADPLLARPQGGLRRAGRPALAGARPVRLPPGSAAQGRLRDLPRRTARRGTSPPPRSSSRRWSSRRWSRSSPPTTSRPTRRHRTPRMRPRSGPGPATARACRRAGRVARGERGGRALLRPGGRAGRRPARRGGARGTRGPEAWLGARGEQARALPRPGARGLRGRGSDAARGTDLGRAGRDRPSRGPHARR